MFIHPHYYSSVFLEGNDDFSGKEPPSRSVLLKSLDHRDLYLERFHKLWYEEYLLGLREQMQKLSG